MAATLNAAEPPQVFVPPADPTPMTWEAGHRNFASLSSGTMPTANATSPTRVELGWKSFLGLAATVMVPLALAAFGLYDVSERMRDITERVDRGFERSEATLSAIRERLARVEERQAVAASSPPTKAP